MNNSIIKKIGTLSENGYSFVELIMVIVFISIALVAILNTYNVGLTSSVGSEHLSLAAQLAEYKMEQIKSDKARQGYDFVIESNYPAETDPQNFTDYSRTVSITTYSEYKEVTVTIAKNGETQITLQAIFTNY
jgi:type II secretory pathway pseudopilin PulG